ncbi:MAG: hypothetical protein AAB958_02600 [Patescibacteria group bacterium]
MKNFNLKSILSIIIISLFISVIFVYADWTPPPAGAPTCPSSEPACNTPINTGSANQYKIGALAIEGVLRGYSDAIFDGKVGIGTANPQAKLDVRGDIRVDGTIVSPAAGIEKYMNVNVGGKNYAIPLYRMNFSSCPAASPVLSRSGSSCSYPVSAQTHGYIYYDACCAYHSWDNQHLFGNINCNDGVWNVGNVNWTGQHKGSCPHY